MESFGEIQFKPPRPVSDCNDRAVYGQNSVAVEMIRVASEGFGADGAHQPLARRRIEIEPFTAMVVIM
jgi:hypothetical protein